MRPVGGARHFLDLRSGATERVHVHRVIQPEKETVMLSKLLARVTVVVSAQLFVVGTAQAHNLM